MELSYGWEQFCGCWDFDDRNHMCPSEESAAVKNKDTR